MARLPEVRGLVERGKYFVIHREIIVRELAVPTRAALPATPSGRRVTVVRA